MTGQVRERGGQKNSCEKPLKNHPKNIKENKIKWSRGIRRRFGQEKLENSRVIYLNKGIILRGKIGEEDKWKSKMS